MPSVSFEYFPPRNESGHSVLTETVDVLSAFQPEFQSVTFGAGGSSRSGTLKIVEEISNKAVGTAASHLTYTGSSEAEVTQFAEELWLNGIRKLVALRGDDRGDGREEVYSCTADFVRALRKVHPFEIAVSCYPEVHPMAQSRKADIAVLKDKQDAGATLAISQFFFDNSVFYEFVAEAREAGVTIPIIPGILPIYNFERVREMASQCGAHIPDFVHDAFDSVNTCGAEDLEVASELLKAQVHDLAIAGFEQIHIYTLNRSHLAGKAAEAFLQAHLDRSTFVKKVA